MLRKMFFYALGFVLLSAAAHSQTSELPDTVWTKFTYPQEIRCVKFTPDGKYLATGGSDAIPKLWDAETGTLVHEFNGRPTGIWDISIVNDFIAFIGPSEGGIQIYNLKNYQLIKTLEGSLNGIFSKDGKYLITGTGSNGEGLSVFETYSWNKIHSTNFQKATTEICLSEDNKFVACAQNWAELNGNLEGKILIYSFPNLNLIKELERKDYLYCPGLSFSFSNEYLAGAISSSPNKVWKTDEWKLFREIGNDGYSITYSPDNKYIVIGEGGFKNWHVNIYDIKSGIKTNTILLDWIAKKYMNIFDEGDTPLSVSINEESTKIAVGGVAGIYMLNAKWNTTSIQDVLQILEPEIFPNPTNNTANIKFNLLKANNVRVDIYNNNSKFITNVLDSYLERGIQSVTWLASVPAGIYFARITAGKYTSSIKIIVNK